MLWDGLDFFKNTTLHYKVCNGISFHIPLRFDSTHKNTSTNKGLTRFGLRAGCQGPKKNPEIGNFYLKKILTPNLVSKVLY
jgi:hypothetical protein